MKKVHELTGWYPGDVHPVRVGVYERQRTETPFYSRFSYWTGKYWCSSARTIKDAYELRRYFSGWQVQNFKWRGRKTQ